MDKFVKTVYLIANEKEIKSVITINQEQHKLFDKLTNDIITEKEFKAKMLHLYDSLKIPVTARNKLRYKYVLMTHNKKEDYLAQKHDFYIEFIDIYGELY